MPRKPAATLAPLPEFTGDRMRLLGPLVTARVIELARLRLTGLELVKGKLLMVPDDDATVKLALIVTHMMNPAEKFSTQEEGRIRGMDPDGVNPGKKERLIRAL